MLLLVLLVLLLVLVLMLMLPPWRVRRRLHPTPLTR
jgi:hypothetical protein